MTRLIIQGSYNVVILSFFSIKIIIIKTSLLLGEIAPDVVHCSAGEVGSRSNKLR